MLNFQMKWDFVGTTEGQNIYKPFILIYIMENEILADGTVKEYTDNGYIKLAKNSRGYNWEIKVMQNKNGTFDLTYLAAINEALIKRYELKEDETSEILGNE